MGQGSLFAFFSSAALRDSLWFSATQREHLSEEQCRDIFDEIDERRQTFADRIVNVDDEDDLSYMLGMMFVELKCSLIILNHQINGSESKFGLSDPLLEGRAWMTSQLLFQIETMLSKVDVDRFKLFLANPLCEN